VYGSYLFADYMQLEKNSAELPGLHLYPVQESHATNAYSWYASSPKLDEPTFDRAIAKIVNDSKAAFLARVNFQATTKYPADDLNISFAVEGYDAHKIAVTITKKQVLKGVATASKTSVTYDRTARTVASMRHGMVDESTNVKDVKLETTPTEPEVDCKKARCVALTFNDGPNPTTARVLDTLKTYKAKATFFEVGSQAKLYPSIAKRTVAEGHAIGMLGENHRNLLTVSLDEAKSDFREGADVIKAATNAEPHLVRAPYGAVTDQLAQKLSLPFIGWGVADQNESNNSQNVYAKIMTNVRAGSIVMSRDTQLATADAYTRIVPDLVKQGYKLVTVPQLLASKKLAPGVYNGN
jgi:peptidoglycan/xylan/chitin deacetylase (PgdA/CDA1 family)